MAGSATVELTLPAEPLTVSQARLAVRRALEDAGASHLSEAAELLVSELVTNAVVHAGTKVSLRITTEAGSIRVEVQDGSSRLPIRRTWTDTAGTGRGLRIVDEHADRWDVHLTNDGKVVWFELGQLTEAIVHNSSVIKRAPAHGAVEVTLLDMPLLMHWAWQEHAATLLREHLLYALERDSKALGEHAAASSALSILDEHLPAPQLPAEPDALMASTVEPSVTAASVTLWIPTDAIGHFATLDDLLVRAVAAAHAGHLLCPPIQPEMVELRGWLCGEIARQASGDQPTPWRAEKGLQAMRGPRSARPGAYQVLAESIEALIATDDNSIIVAVTPAAVDYLGYASEADLLGQRVLVVIPQRFHQAHIAGTTLHVTNGRDALLNQWVTVPITKADGTEVSTPLHVVSRRLETDVHVFIAHLHLPDTPVPALF